MSANYGNITTKGASQEAVIEVVTQLRQTAFITPAVEEYVLVFPEEVARGAWLAARLSQALACTAFFAQVHEDQVFAYELFEAGELTDRYNSSPGFDTGRDIPPSGGDAHRLCVALGVPPDAAPDIEPILRSFPHLAADGLAITEDDIDALNRLEDYPYLFASERHQDLVNLLLLPDSTGYDFDFFQLERGRTPRAFSSVAQLHLNRPVDPAPVREYLLLNPPPHTDAEHVGLWWYGEEEVEEIITRLGTPAEVAARVKDALPETDLTIPNRLIAGGRGYTLDICLGSGDALETATVYAWAENMSALEAAETRLRHLTDVTGWRVFSTASRLFV